MIRTQDMIVVLFTRINQDTYNHHSTDYLYSKTLPVTAERLKFFEVSHFLWLLSPLPPLSLSLYRERAPRIKPLMPFPRGERAVSISPTTPDSSHLRLIASPSCPFCPQIILPPRSLSISMLSHALPFLRDLGD